MSAPNICPSCSELSPPSESDTTTTLTELAKAAGKGCETCALINHAIHECLPEVLATDADSVTISVRQAIMRSFVEVVVKWSERAVTLDLFVKAGK